MTRGILIAGNESALFSALAGEAVKRVEAFAVAPIPSRFSGRGQEDAVSAPEPAARIFLPWNPGNPVSARGLILAAENRLERIDEAILVCAPPTVNGPAATMNPVDIEIMVNDHIKGWFFLVKELAAAFKARKSGVLALVAPEIVPGGSRDAFPDLLGSSAAAAFRAFSHGFLSASFEEPYQTLGFTGAAPGEEAAFAAYIFKIMEEPGRRNTGKWHKFSRLNIFGR